MRIPCPSHTFLKVSAIQIDASLTPFLYQTPTIQQWIAPYAPARKQRRRHASTQREQHVPMERSTGSSRRGGSNTRATSQAQVQAQAQGGGRGRDQPLEKPRSTMSAKEKRVFTKLLDPSYDPQAELKDKDKSRSASSASNHTTTSNNNAKLPSHMKLYQNRPGTYAHALDRKFNDRDLAEKHEAFYAAKRRDTALQQQRMDELRAAQQDGVAPPVWEGEEAFQQQREQMLSLARLQFSRAKTDEELWELLAKWTFAIIRRHLGHDPRVTRTKLTPEQLEVRKQQEATFLTYNYPLLLTTFLDELRTNFPSSQLAFTVLPMVKSLGRQSYVLGASTGLYNGIILDTWRVFSDFHRINELLLEMENAGLEFDYDTLDVLGKIRRQGDRILKGERGVLLKRVWELDSIVSGWSTVVAWIPKVKERLEADALRRASETEDSEMEDSVSEEDWDEELSVMQQQQDALRRAAASLG